MIIELTERDILPRSKNIDHDKLSIWKDFYISMDMVQRADKITFKKHVFKERKRTVVLN